MKKELLGMYTLCVLGLFAPIQTAAYFTKAQSAEYIEDGNGILYTVTYDFGLKSCDLYMPILPVRADEINTLSYTFVDENEDLVYQEGSAVGVVVSDAQIRDNAYFIPLGEAQRFTMIVLLALPTDPLKKDLALQVTGLPFKISCDTKTIDAHLNPSELQYYRTPTISTLEADAQ